MCSTTINRLSWKYKIKVIMVRLKYLPYDSPLPKGKFFDFSDEDRCI